MAGPAEPGVAGDESDGTIAELLAATPDRGTMLKRYFTRGEVDALIPELTRIMGAVMTAHARVTALKAALDGEQQRIAMAGGGVIDRGAWQRATAEIRNRTDVVQRGLGEIVALGGVPKDLGLGLVDFPHVLHNEEVNLCWRHGEPEVRFWHGLDEGYGARRPL